MQPELWNEFWHARERMILGRFLRWGRRRFVSTAMTRFLLHHTDRGVLVEAGCGTGEVVLEVARVRGDRVVLVDLSEQALDLARASFDDAQLPVQTLRCDIAELDTHLARIDDGTVFNIGVIEHFDDCTNVLRQMAAVAGRKAIALIPERSLFWRTFVAASRPLGLVPSDFFIRFYDEQSLRSVVRRAGLVVVGTKRIRVGGLVPYLAVEFHS